MTVGIWTCCSDSCFLKASEDSKAFQVASQASEPASQPLDRWTDGGKERKFPNSTGYCPLSGLLPRYSPTTTGI